MTIKTKKDLRERILTLLRNQKEEERLIKSLSIKDKLFHNKKIKEAKTIFFYASFNGEVDTTKMIIQARQSGKRIALPRINVYHKEILPTLWEEKSLLEDGPYGIKQPKDNPGHRLSYDEIDAVIVPGVAFDKGNHRLGHGGGYYDRFLSSAPGDIPTFGLAFDFQCVETIPELSDHDIPVTFVVHN